MDGEKQRMIFDALITESQFLREEEMLAIQNIRKLTITSLTISGFAIPVFAGLIGITRESESGLTFDDLLRSNAPLIYIVLLGMPPTLGGHHEREIKYRYRDRQDRAPSPEWPDQH